MALVHGRGVRTACGGAGPKRRTIAASSARAAPAAVAPPPPALLRQPPPPPHEQAALRGSWAYRLLDRVSLAARRLEEIEAASAPGSSGGSSGTGGSTSGSSVSRARGKGEADADADENADDDVGAALDALFEEHIEPVFMSRNGYRLPPKERRVLDASGGSAAYGEALPRGVRAIARRALALDAAALLASSSPPFSSSAHPPPVFVDLGCGTGRAVLQVAGEIPGIARAVGIELGPTRLEQAEAALELLRRERGWAGQEEEGRGEGAGRRRPLAPVEFLLDDLRDCDLAATGGTHFYACTTAFGAALCRSLAERLARGCPSFRVLATTRALPPQPHLALLGRVGGVEYSWTGRTGAAYVYARSAEDAPPEVLARLWGGGPEAGAVALPSASPRALALRGLVAEEPVVAAAAGGMEAAAVRKGEDDEGEG
jgi:hypothetical protein